MRPGDIVPLEDMDSLAGMLRERVKICDRQYRFRTYKSCFLGSDAVKALIDSQVAEDEEQALLIGNVLVENGIIAHVTRDHPLKN